ncbi:MAG: DNA polymerase III subunit delta [Planctomycetota bacterium]
MPKKKPTARKSTRPAIGPDTRVLALHGGETMLMQEHLGQLKASLSAEHGEIETFRFDGKAATLSDIFDELRGYSLMVTYKLVVVDEADQFVKSFRKELERYTESPVDHATLVLRGSTWNKGNLDKLIAKVGAVIKCDAPKPAEAAGWLVGRAQEAHGATIQRNAASLLVERLGPHLMLLDTELGKLALMAGGKPIDAALVEEAVGRGNEEKAWVMQEPLLRGLASGRAAAPLEKIGELIDLGGNDPVPVMWSVIDLARKLAVASAMKRAGENESAITKAAKVWGPQVRPFMDVVRRLEPTEAAGMLVAALRADARTKTGLGNGRGNLEAICVTLTDNKDSARLARAI